MSSLDNVSTCGATGIIVFVLTIFFGTAFSIASKVLISLNGSNDEDGSPQEESFHKPIFLTFVMFLAMMLVLPLHWAVMIFKINFTGYKFGNEDEGADTGNGDDLNAARDPWVLDYFNFKPKSSSATSIRMYFILAIPAVFDLIANALMFIGLQYLDVSIHQTLRGAQIIFVALLKEYVLKHHLLKFHWVGVFWNMVSVVLVGVAALLAGYGGDEGSKDVTTAETILGVGLTLLGTFAQALTYATEEHIMKVDDPAPPLLVTGMIGFWGTVLCVVIVFPLAYWLPGDDHGSYEEPFSSWETMSSVWHAMVVNFRPITVWATELFIYYVISQSYGEEWTHESFLLIAGMLILIYGTSIYNAPNAGSILLDGHWYSFGIDCSEEYEAMTRKGGGSCKV
eukprot:scaffold38770_cov63-Cyclotella_meneghiniana.AAC.2